MKEKILTFGQKAVGVDATDTAEVTACKMGFAKEIDRMNDLSQSSYNGEQISYALKAITDLKRVLYYAVSAIQVKEDDSINTDVISIFSY